MKLHELSMLAGMSFRNLGRHRVKTVITVIAVAVSVTLYIFMDGWLLGMTLESERNIVAYETGAAKIQTRAYFDKKDDLPMYESFGNWEPLARVLEDAGYDSAPRFVFTGTLHAANGSAPVLCTGVDVTRECRLLRYPDYLDSGRFPAAGAYEIALGMLTADKLGLAVPRRMDAVKFDRFIETIAPDPSDAARIRGLYEARDPANGKKRPFSGDGDAPRKPLVYLKADAEQADIEYIWDRMGRAGLLDVRIFTTIDIKALPERIDASRFTEDILPRFSSGDRGLLETVYEADPVLGDYFLVETGTDTAEKALALLLASDYTGAVRHVNQLIPATVTGVVNSPNPKNNANTVYMPLDALQDSAGLQLDGAVTELIIRRKDANDASLPGEFESPEAIRSVFKESSVPLPEDLVVKGWQDYVKDYISASASDKISTRVMIFMLFLLSFLGISNTMLMAILERTKEIGMLRALGMTDSQVLFVYALEASFIGMIGGFVGVVLGCLINIPMVTIGIDYSAMTEALSGDIGYRVAAFFRSAWNVPVIIGTFFAATLVSGVMAVLPARRALRMPVTESLRFE